jgi:hypothetical protein
VIGDTDMEYLIEVNYKTGKTVRFWAKNFSYIKDSEGIKFSWTASSKEFGPIYLGADGVESVWKVGVRNSEEPVE